MPSRFTMPNADVGAGISPSNGAQLFFFTTGTANKLATFSDSDGTIPNPNPVTADANGVFPDIWIEGVYKVVLKDKNGKQTGFGEADPVLGFISSDVTETITSLKAITGQTDGEAVTLLGHTERGKGGGEFYFDSSSSATDNNGTIIQPDIGSGRWLRNDESAINVMWFGALGDETTNDTVAIQTAINTGDHVYLPNASGERYLISATLLVLGEDGLGRVREGFRMTADAGSRDNKHLLQVASGSGIEAVIQILDGVSSNPIITLCSFENISIDGNGEAVFGLACGKWNSSINQLVKMFHTENLSIKDCRFGYMIGGAASIETDSAGYSNINTVIEDCDDGGVLIDTGNGAAITFMGYTFNGNGFNPTTEGTYNPSGDGANIKVVGGEFNSYGGTTAGLGATQPATADIIANSADIRINGHWSDTHGICIKESGGVDASIYINGLRHNEGGMNNTITGLSEAASMVATIGTHPFIIGTKISFQDVLGMTEVNGNTYSVTAITATTITLNVNSTGFTTYTSAGLATSTPVSIQHQAKITVEGSLLNGVFESNEGQSGSITTLGCNFVSGGPAGSNSTAYTGTLKTNQKGVLSLNNFGNRAQIAIGGGTVDMIHKGAFTPQWLGIGAGSSATGPTCLSQALGPAATDSGYTEYLDQSTGTKTIYINCFKSDTAGNIAPILNAKDCHIIDIGGGSFNALLIRRHKFADDTPVAQSTFVPLFEIRQGGSDGTISQAVIVPPLASIDPSFSSGDYWEGGMYYNTTTNKMRYNVGGTAWVDMS